MSGIRAVGNHNQRAGLQAALLLPAQFQAVLLLAVCLCPSLHAQSPTQAKTDAPAGPQASQAEVPSTVRRPIAKRRRHQATTTAIHKAWLKEIIDIDRDSAVDLYDEVIKTSSAEQPDRWIAVSRLRELGRLGVLHPEPLASPSQEPPDVKAALTLLDQPFPYTEVLTHPDSGIDLPPLRPATPLVQDWVRDQIGLTMQERYRSIPRTAGPRNAGDMRHWREIDILRRDIEGNRPQADGLRALYFRNWKPPVVTGDRGKVLAEALRRLEAWIATEENPFDRQELRRLEKGIKKLAEEGEPSATGAHEAVELIRRLPNYSSRLLEPQPNESPK